MIDWKKEGRKTAWFSGGYAAEETRRSQIAAETDLGLRLLKEYRGSVNRLEFEEAVLQSLDGTRDSEGGPICEKF